MNLYTVFGSKITSAPWYFSYGHGLLIWSELHQDYRDHLASFSLVGLGFTYTCARRSCQPVFFLHFFWVVCGCGWSNIVFVFFSSRMFHPMITDIQRKFRNLTSDYTESCCWRSVNQEMWSHRCDTAEMCDMSIWRVGIARNAVFFHSFVSSLAGKVTS